MVHFYAWGPNKLAKPRNINPRKERVAVLPSKCRHATLEKTTITAKFPPPHAAAYRAVGRKRHNCGPVNPAHGGVTLAHVTNICHLRILDTSCERSTCTNEHQVQNYKWPVARFPLSVSLHQCSTFTSIYTCSYEDKRAKPGNLPTGNALSEIGKYPVV